MNILQQTLAIQYQKLAADAYDSIMLCRDEIEHLEAFIEWCIETDLRPAAFLRRREEWLLSLASAQASQRKYSQKARNLMLELNEETI